MTKIQTAKTGLQTIIDAENKSVTVHFLDAGNIRETIVARLADFDDSITDYSALIGIKNKLIDAAAISVNRETGQSASIHDKFDAVHRVFEQLQAGEWNATRKPGEPSGGLFATCYSRLAGITLSEAKTKIAALGDKLGVKQQRYLLQYDARFNAMAETVRAERQARKPSTVDTDSLLGELGL